MRCRSRKWDAVVERADGRDKLPPRRSISSRSSSSRLFGPSSSFSSCALTFVVFEARREQKEIDTSFTARAVYKYNTVTLTNLIWLATKWVGGWVSEREKRTQDSLNGRLEDWRRASAVVPPIVLQFHFDADSCRHLSVLVAPMCGVCVCASHTKRENCATSGNFQQKRRKMFPLVASSVRFRSGPIIGQFYKENKPLPTETCEIKIRQPRHELARRFW